MKNKLFILISTFSCLSFAKGPVVYSCKKTVYRNNGIATEEGKTSKTSKKLEFVGESPYQKFVLDLAGNISTLTLTEIQNENQKPESVERLSCDSFLNCTGFKIKYKESGTSKMTNLLIKPNGTSVTAAFGERVIFQFYRIERGFAFRSIKFPLEKGLFAGTEISCQK